MGGYKLLPRQLRVQRLQHRILRRGEIGEPVAQRINVGKPVDLIVDTALDIETIDVGKRRRERRARRSGA